MYTICKIFLKVFLAFSKYRLPFPFFTCIEVLKCYNIEIET